MGINEKVVKQMVNHINNWYAARRQYILDYVRDNPLRENGGTETYQSLADRFKLSKQGVHYILNKEKKR
jgi:hypothetical protein